MLKTNSVFKALREVKRIAANMERHTKIYVAYNAYYERFLVSVDSETIEEEILSTFLEHATDSDAGEEAAEYRVYRYESRTDFPSSSPDFFKAVGYKHSLMTTEPPLIRKIVEVVPHMWPTFEING